MNDFTGWHFEGQIIHWAVRWSCKYGISYRESETMLEEREIAVDHATIHGWAQRYASEIERRLRWSRRQPRSTSWRVDGNYGKVKGRWACPCKAIDKRDDSIDLHLSPTRNGPTLGFQSPRIAFAIIPGFEVMRALKKGQGFLFHYLPSVAGEVSLVHRTFGLT